MPINDRTPNRDYAKPAAPNLLSEDVERLRSALDAIDSDVVALMTAMLLRAPLVSPQFTGTPTAPTPDPDTTTAQIITAAYLLAMFSNAAPVANGSASAGVSTRMARADHRHPTDTTRAPLDSPQLTGTPTAPTPDTADNSTKLATTAWVLAQAFVRGNRTIFTGAGLLGGGDLSANRTLAPDFATQAEAEARAAADKVMSPVRTAQAIASLFATQPEAEARTAADRLMSPLRTAQAIASLLASQAEAEAGAAADKLMTPQRTAQAIAAASNANKTFTGTIGLEGSVRSNIIAVPALDIDCSAGNYFTKTINANSTFTVSNVPASRCYIFTLELTHASGTITWFAGVQWPDGVAPTLTTGRTHLFTFVTDDGGTRWRACSAVNYTT
jgi:hypothetical protein